MFIFVTVTHVISICYVSIMLVIIGMSTIACQEGTYKSVYGNSDCSDCPDNSYSSSPGSVSCQCLYGYYRAPDENAALSCTGK